jgi:hypothetical protein
MQIIKKTKTLIVVSASAFISLSTQAYAATSNSDLCKKVTTTPGLQKCVNNNPIVDDLRTIINALSFGVGVIIIIMIILGGIQYMAAGDNPNGVTAAKQRVSNALIALAVFLLTFAFLQWLIPGGAFNG